MTDAYLRKKYAKEAKDKNCVWIVHAYNTWDYDGNDYTVRKTVSQEFPCTPTGRRQKEDFCRKYEDAFWVVTSKKIRRG